MTRPLVTVLLAVGLGACGQQAPADQPSPARTPRPAPVSAVPGGFGPTERAFVDLAISTADQAVRLLDLGAERAADPDRRALAGDLARTRRAERAALGDLLAAASLPYQDQHIGHDMPGRPTEDELAELAELPAAGPAFAAAFDRLLRAHLTESAAVARTAAEQVRHAGTRGLASAMADERTAALARLDRLG